MNKLLTILCRVLFVNTTVCNAQEKSAKASYNALYNFENIDSNMEISFDIQEVLDKESNKDYELVFTKGRSLFYQKEVARVNNPKIKLNFFNFDTNRNDTLYIDQNSKLFSHKKNYGKEDRYIIKGTLPQIEWTIGKGSKKIGNYYCKKATAKLISSEDFEHTEEIVAWFTEDIPMSIFPEKYLGLPGLVVELKTHDIEYSLISFQYIDAETLNPPKQGDVITNKEFRKIYDEYEK